ncbi:zincin-like metallopeptidase domain-containing protein, partial [Bradyrhizobium sp. 145]|uniref:zincin-like metallopeptidase domain-containing protein n=1 Tax=Bradyrhizobium sp. 145 TaxID=2782621 RepID=UPI001FFA2D79
SDEDYAEWDWRDHAANRAQPSRCGIIWIAALCTLCRYRHKAHASGHPSRLNRDMSGSFGTKKYAFEELVAEIASAFGCASLGIVPTVRHADYIGSWLDVLREDNRAIVRAASQASKVADYLLGFLPAPAADMKAEKADQEAA